MEGGAGERGMKSSANNWNKFKIRQGRGGRGEKREGGTKKERRMGGGKERHKCGGCT